MSRLSVMASLASVLISTIVLISQWRISRRLDAVEDLLIHQRNTTAYADKRHEENQLLQLLTQADESSWVSSNGPIEVRLAVESDRVVAGHDVRLIAEVRNASPQRQIVSAVSLYAFDVSLYRDGQKVTYVGAVPQLLAPMPVELRPGGIARAFVTLSPEQFPELTVSGAFRAEWTYSTIGGVGAITWRGTLPAAKANWQAIQ